MRYRIEHETILEYQAPIREHHVELRLTPREDQCHKLLSRSVETVPDATLGSYNDYYGNRVDYFCVIPPHNRLVTRISTEVETLTGNPFDFEPLPPNVQRDQLRKMLREEPSLHDYILHRSAVTPPAMKVAADLKCAMPRCDADTPLMEALIALMAWVPTVLEYQSGATEVHASLLDAVKKGAGVCQDFAHLFISISRSWGVPVRYVMGYLDPGLDSENRANGATHAWAEALIPGAGWLGFDATQNLLANEHYIPVAVGRDSYDAAPQRGSFKGDDPGSQPVVNLTIVNQQ